MSKISLVLVGDLHFSDKPMVSRIDNYEDTIFNKFSQIRDIAIKSKASAIVTTGDVFHVPYAYKVPHKLVSRMVRTFLDLGCDFCGVAGNHDMVYGRVETLEHQPLAVLIESGAFKRVDIDPVLYKSGDLCVKVSGISYGMGILDLEDRKKEKNVDFMVSVIHDFCNPEGGNFFGSNVWSYKELAETDADYFLIGHDHSVKPDYKVVNCSGIEKMFSQPGSLTRGSLTEDVAEREVFVDLLEIEKVKGKISYKTTRKKLNIEPAERVFNIEKYDLAKKNESDFREFCDRLSNDSISFSNAAGVVKHTLGSMSISGEVRERSLHYLLNRGL